MTDDTTPIPEDDVILAAEYALGLLEPDDRAAAEARLRDDPAFAAEVRRWQEDLAVLARDLDEVPPSPAGREALMARLFEEGRAGARSRTQGGPWRRWRWRLVSALAAAVLIVALLVDPAPEPGPSHVAELQPAARDFVLTAALTLGDAPLLELTRIDGPAAPAGRATELWAIAPDAAPVSLGVLPAAATWTVSLPPELAAQAEDLTLALSDEPEGGSPTGAPTGEVLATAALDEL